MTYQAAIVAVLQDLWRFVTAGGSGESVIVSPVPGTGIGPTESVTQHIRLVISGQFTKNELARALQPSEYVLYRLIETGVTIPTAARMWEAGSWHQHLKGEGNFHIGITPVPHSVIEYFSDTQVGNTAWVESVDDDMTITLCGVDLERKGVFEVCTWSAADWQELRPVFITYNKKI